MDDKCYLKLAYNMPRITVITIGMNASPQSQISETVVEKKEYVEKFSKIISGILRREATHKNSSVLGWGKGAPFLRLEKTGLKLIRIRKIEVVKG